MNWLSLLRRTLAASRRPVVARAGAAESGARAEPRSNEAPNSTFGYGALVIGTSHSPPHRAH